MLVRHLRRPWNRRLALVALAAVLVTAALATVQVERARAVAARCQQHALDAAARSRIVTGQGPAVTVIGDSWSVGLGLRDKGGSWPSQLPARVSVAGFSGSGFSRHASPCGNRMFAARDHAAAGADLVVVEGGLNDYDQPTAEIRAGFADLMAGLRGRRVVVVGPAPAPSRAGAVPRVDHALAALCREYGVPYVDASDWQLPYLPDRLHLTAAGHREFGLRVAARLSDLGLLVPA